MQEGRKKKSKRGREREEAGREKKWENREEGRRKGGYMRKNGPNFNEF